MVIASFPFTGHQIDENTKTLAGTFVIFWYLMGLSLLCLLVLKLSLDTIFDVTSDEFANAKAKKGAAQTRRMHRRLLAMCDQLLFSYAKDTERGGEKLFVENLDQLDLASIEKVVDMVEVEFCVKTYYLIVFVIVGLAVCQWELRVGSDRIAAWEKKAALWHVTC